MNETRGDDEAGGVAGRLRADLLTCLAFFSRLPLPDHPARPFGLAIRALPGAALVIGLCGALPLLAAHALGLPAPMAALAATAAGLLVTGGLHEDGLADTLDGFGGGRTPARKLAIMRDSRIGSYGVLALLVALGWRVTALATLAERGSAGTAALVLLGAAVQSRAVALLPLLRLPPARADGLGHGVGVIDRSAWRLCGAMAAALGAAAVCGAGLGVGHALMACGGAVLAALLLCRLARAQIGGQTGDVAGAAQQCGEAAFLLGCLVWPA